MSPLGLLLGVAAATPRPVGTDGGPLPADGVVRVAFEGVPPSLVTADDGTGADPVPLLQTRCTTAKDGETELCVFGFPDDVPLGVLGLDADAMATSIELSDSVDVGYWEGTVEQLSATVSQREDPDIGELVVDVDSVWQAPAAPSAGYLLEVRDETGRPVDWRTLPVDSPTSLMVAPATEVLVPYGEICLQAAVFDPYDAEVWQGNRICEDMPKQPDPACRGCAAGGAGAVLLPGLLGLLGLARRRQPLP